MDSEAVNTKPRSSSQFSEPSLEAPVELSWEYEESGPALVDEFFEENDSEQLLSDVEVDPVSESLCSGLLEKFVPRAENAQRRLEEIQSSQRVLIETLQQENNKFSETEGLQEAEHLFKKTREYLGRLEAVAKQMHSISERTSKVKKRAIRLQQQAQRARLQAEVERDKQIEYDRKLKPVIRRPTDDSSPGDEHKPV